MQPLNESINNIPAFLSKLWKMVNDPTTDHLISWGPNGTSFIIQNQATFWYDLLPVYYKHNNMSSFVRQLNMYGFHKMSSIDSSTESDKDEMKFYHPYFQQNKPDLMKNIKRKVTTSKHSTIVPDSTNQSLVNPEDITTILSDVKHLKGRQSSVDSQLSAMKQENAVLWRELALLRQKHLKQQQIVNKLIQFLVTIVQPTRMSNLGVKRHLPLMINENPEKKMKASKPESTTSEGPIIHELDNAESLQDELLADAAQVQEVFSPNVENMSESGKSTQSVPSVNADVIWDNPEFVSKIQGDNLEELLSDTELPDESVGDECLPTEDEKIFLNPSTQDTLLSNLMNGNYNPHVIKDAKGASTSDKKEGENATKEEMTVATRKEGKHKLSRLNSVEDLDLHLEHTQNELNQFKELLSCTTLDANALLGLFNDESPPYGLSYNDNNQNEEALKAGTNVPSNLNQLMSATFSDPLVSGSELATYNNAIDFSQLFDDSSSEEYLKADMLPPTLGDLQDSINTPNVNTTAPSFPTTSNKSKK